MECFFKDYKQVGGIWFAYTHEYFMGGEYWAIYEFEKIEIDIPIDESIFKMPGK